MLESEYDEIKAQTTKLSEKKEKFIPAKKETQRQDQEFIQCTGKDMRGKK